MAVSALSLLALACVAAAAAAQHHGGYGKHGYFQYVNVPGKKQYEHGYRRGNGYHNIARYEQAKDHRFRTRVVWKDAKGGYGEHYWEYNHGPKKGYGHSSHGHSGGGHKGHHGHHGGYGHHHDGGLADAVSHDEVPAADFARASNQNDVVLGRPAAPQPQRQY